MSAELAMRTVGVLACATTLSLLTTIGAYAAANAATLRWDGSFCGARECTAAVSVTTAPASGRVMVAKLPARAS